MGCWGLFLFVMLSSRSCHSLSRNPIASRAKFLSSSAATFLVSTTSILASDPESCTAAIDGGVGAGSSSSSGTLLTAGNAVVGDNPRYIERELEMTYGQGPDGNPRKRGIFVRRLTGDSTPYSFPAPREVRFVQEWPNDKAPFKPEDFFRADQIDDSAFYTVPRLVYHIDEPAVASLTQYYRNNINKGSNILDICSSWVSHYPIEFPNIMNNICATGMNGLEMQFNDQLTGGYKAKDLNNDPVLPYDNNSFDVVTCVVSIDYMIQPIEVLKEVNRVLKPGGKVIISQSNRCFPTKAIAMWLKMNDRQHLELINGYLKYAGGYKDVKAYDITATTPDNSYRDPMFIVEAYKA